MFGLIITLPLAYVIGSLCSAIFVCKGLGLPDPRTEGSKNPGATNVLRIGGKQAALLTLAGDVLKGFLPVLLARIFQIDGFGLGLVALATLLGHIFPLFFEFKGGKGIATSFGAILALSLTAGIFTAIIWGVVAAVTAYASLASLIAAAIAPLLIIWKVGIATFVPVFIMSALLFWRHKENIDRLKAGNENKLDWTTFTKK